MLILLSGLLSVEVIYPFIFGLLFFFVKMDPIHLSTHELEYELNIRGVFNLSSRRLKTSSLSEFLKKESIG